MIGVVVSPVRLVGNAGCELLYFAVCCADRGHRGPDGAFSSERGSRSRSTHCGKAVRDANDRRESAGRPAEGPQATPTVFRRMVCAALHRGERAERLLHGKNVRGSPGIPTSDAVNHCLPQASTLFNYCGPVSAAPRHESCSRQGRSFETQEHPTDRGKERRHETD
jgi:hypothetical protein